MWACNAHFIIFLKTNKKIVSDKKIKKTINLIFFS